MSSVNMSQSTDIFFTCNGRSLIWRISPKLHQTLWMNEHLYMAHKNIHTKPYVFTMPGQYWVFRGVRAIECILLSRYNYKKIIKKTRENKFFKIFIYEEWWASSIGYRDQRGQKPCLHIGIPYQTPQTYSWLLAKNMKGVPRQYWRSNKV